MNQTKKSIRTRTIPTARLVSGKTTRPRKVSSASLPIGIGGTMPQTEQVANPAKQLCELEPHYTVREVADIYRVTPRCVRQWIDNKELRAWRRGRLIRIPRRAIPEFDRTR